MFSSYIPFKNKAKKYNTKNINYAVPRHFKKPCILIIGCGDIGQRIINILPKFWRFISINSKNKLNYSDNYMLEQDNTSLEKSYNLKQLSYIYNLDEKINHKIKKKYNLFNKILKLSQNIIYLVPPQNFTTKDLRIHHLHYLLHIKKKINLLYISTTGVYGNRDGEIVYEHTNINLQTERAKRRVYAENYLRNLCKKSRDKRLSIFRVSGIYAKDKLPLDRIKNNIPILNTTDDIYTNHIHALDLAKILFLALVKKTANSGRIFNICDNSKIKAGDWIEYIAKNYNLPCPTRMSRQELMHKIDKNRLSFLTESRLVSNKRLLKEFKYKLIYPTIYQGI